MVDDGRWHIIEADCVTHLKTLPENSVDAVVTDPPYGLLSGPGVGLMGHIWDGSGVSFQKALWLEVYRIVRPGSHILAFGGTRTYHRLVCAMEDAGFEIRDSIIAFCYANGFPKSYNLEGGLGTGLKPAWEPVVVGRRPLAGSTEDNYDRHRTGVLNIDATRVGGDPWTRSTHERNDIRGDAYGRSLGTKIDTGGPQSMAPAGRWPPNLVLVHSPSCRRIGSKIVQNTAGSVTGLEPSSLDRSDMYGGYADRGPWTRYGGESGEEVVEAFACADGCPVAEMDRQSGELAPQHARVLYDNTESRGTDGFKLGAGVRPIPHEDSGGASRFFPQFSWDTEEVSFIYCPKPSRTERDAGAGPSPILVEHGERWREVENAIEAEQQDGQVFNRHPAVKPIALMRWLCRLVTPPGGLVLDPFVGSGSTGAAAMIEGFRFLGIDSNAEYCGIARKRIAYWESQPRSSVPSRPTMERPQVRPLVAEGDW